MKSILLAGMLLLIAGVFAVAQEPVPKPDTVVKDNTTEREDRSDAVEPDKPANVGQNDYVRPDSKTRTKRYIKSLVGPMTLGRRIASTGYSTWQNSPEEWGPHWDGFGRRFASSMGKGAIKQTTTYALDEALKLDSHYYRSRKKDFRSKVTNALLSPVTARDQNGKRVIGIPRLAGTYAAGIIAAETWYPERYNWKNGVRSGTTSLAMTAAFNLFKEFVWKE